MKLIKVASAALNQTPFDWVNNYKNIYEAIDKAKKEKVDLLCLPEMCITGYGCEDQYHSVDLLKRAKEHLQSIVKQSKGITVVVGLPFVHQNSLFNGAAMIADGRLLGITAKRFLAGDGIHYENRWFKPWSENTVAHSEEFDCPIGNVAYNLDGVKIGVEVCEDAWIPNRPANQLAQQGVDIIINPSASHFAFGKQKSRRELVSESARQFKCVYVYSNLIGNESGRAIYSGDTLIADPNGLISAGPLLSFNQIEMVSAVVDLDTNRTHRLRTASLQPDLKEKKSCLVEGWLQSQLTSEPVSAVRLSSLMSKEEELSRAVALGLRDYMAKSNSNGFVVSLSGGADSAAVACLVRLIDRYTKSDVGTDTVTPLTCVYQPTRNSSDTTFDAAKTLALELQADFHVIDVDEMVEAYKSRVGGALDIELNWDDHDIALQNIQARARAPGVWMIANLRNALLLATSNRSEAAVGYATMDGDTCGGLSPVAGVDKEFLLEWLRYAQIKYDIKALKKINSQTPTAELRPSEQSDEGDLMPYNLLDAIQKLAIRDKKSPLEVLDHLSGIYPTSRKLLADHIEKFYRLWARNQWKRERYAPSFHLDDENLDPKTWCRFPIVSGGFASELLDMRKYV